MNTYTRLEHDEAVRHLAMQLLSDGYEVQARIEGWFNAPDYIYGYRPDIVAMKGAECLIVEIQKGDVDWPKLSAFERYKLENNRCEIRFVTPEQLK